MGPYAMTKPQSMKQTHIHKCTGRHTKPHNSQKYWTTNRPGQRNKHNQPTSCHVSLHSKSTTYSSTQKDSGKRKYDLKS